MKWTEDSPTSAGAVTKQTLFDLDSLPWISPPHLPRGEGSGIFPQAVVDEVDLVAFLDGSRIKALDLGVFNILMVNLPRGHFIPRHHHNVDQLVFVVDGEAIQGRRVLRPGNGYFTPAGRSYTLSAGAAGLTYMEIRTDPISEVQTIWDEADPAKWVHRAIETEATAPLTSS